MLRAVGVAPIPTHTLAGTTSSSTDPIPVSLEPSPVIEAYKAGVDRTLLRENLKLSPDERVRKMISVLRFAEEVRRSGREAAKR